MSDKRIINENLISEILQDINEKEMQKIDDKFSDLDFEMSKETDQKILSAIENQSKAKLKFDTVNHFAKRAAVIAVIMLSLTVTSLITVEGLGTRITDFIVQTYDKLVVIFVGEKDDDYDEVSQNTLGLKWLPKGFKLELEGKFSNSNYARYTSEKNGSFVVIKDEKGNQSFSIASENSIIEKIYIDDVQAIYCYKNNCDDAVLIFSHDDNLFIIDAENVKRETMIKIAKSIMR